MATLLLGGWGDRDSANPHRQRFGRIEGLDALELLDVTHRVVKVWLALCVVVPSKAFAVT